MKELDELEVEQAKLDAIDNQLSAAITSIEDALRERVSIGIGIDTEGATFSRIAFGKNGGEWCLQIVMSGTWCQLRKASRATRAEALAGGHIARLITESPSLVRAEVANRQAATRAASDILAMLAK